MGCACRVHGRVPNFIQVLVGNRKSRSCLEELGLNGTSTLKLTLGNEMRSLEWINLAKGRMPVNLCEGCNELSVSKNFGDFLL